MANVALMGWDADAKVWRKVLVNSAGKLIIDPSEIFEDPPTDGEAGKAPTSNWSHDHAADASAHHTKFTITEHDSADRHSLANLDPLVCSEAEADTKIATHKGDASAHHAKYTDAEARAAVGYNGTKFWSTPGIGLDGLYPQADGVHKGVYGNIQVITGPVTMTAPVNLPHAAVVTAVYVTGNAGAGYKTWELRRVNLLARSVETMASGTVNTSDSDIQFGGIDNNVYAYWLLVSALDTDDEIYGASITYTI